MKRLSSKVSKHEQTAALARAKIDTISGLVSKALADNEISDKEFSLIIVEMSKFNDLKQEIRRKSQKEEKKTRHEATTSGRKKRDNEKTNNLNHTTRVISLHTEKTGVDKSLVLKLYKESW